ncbi:sensor histidine kinase [Leptospira sp. 2 VSF19]|uniref:histidine kinase n=1 Tax=Leptospira soteropolitanensis TaxID=2950025 RepID=A0AAW5VHR5_9LEPT|nr:sensor histidine kinase [Leptospira soteropolitanensis]MCW7493541.1 sensor histidine kinase [Leptospira soteropolitanensis]MCW7500927.1 sensor histidine kinase [Leptospira soteropolitanensis]MCW7523393.1 sensor histidine kinase [Leptospira soteropolitanensis]MCW7527254.1 sensor histidine kinase [Leptospira soteropolitanensis]MCW7531111.1 sensor histidine kinase [Leptospira soteropolitanensis]
MNFISLLNLSSLSVYIIAIYIIIRRLIEQPSYRGEGSFVLILAIIPCYVSVSNVFEHGYSIDYFDDYEGFFKDLYAMFFLIFLYVHSLKKEQSKRNEQERQIKSDLKLKSKLLTEIHHRVNNNLQIISGLLAMQVESENDIKLTTSLGLIQNRIMAIASVHKIIYESPNLLYVDLNLIFNSILGNLKVTYINEKSNIELHELIEEGLEMDLDRAIPMGLILNELVSNSFRHAFMNRNEGKIEVSLGRIADQFLLIVKDNGGGTENVEMEVKGMGLTLVKNLVKQLRGTIKIENENGMNIEIKFPILNENSIHI